MLLASLARAQFLHSMKKKASMIDFGKISKVTSLEYEMMLLLSLRQALYLFHKGKNEYFSIYLRTSLELKA